MALFVEKQEQVDLLVSVQVHTLVDILAPKKADTLALAQVDNLDEKLVDNQEVQEGSQAEQADHQVVMAYTQEAQVVPSVWEMEDENHFQTVAYPGVLELEVQMEA